MELLKSVVSLGTFVIFTNFIQAGNDKRFADSLAANDKRALDSDKRFADNLAANDKRALDSDKRFVDNLAANDKRFKDNLAANDKRFSDLLLTLRDTKSEDRARIDDKISMLSTAVKDMKEEKKG